jgi:proprotein convertase subtilisin/kexin type 5
VCPYDCLSCDANKSCLTCDSNDFRTLSSSRCIALVGYFDDGTSSKCISCPLNCTACVSLAKCTACKPGYFMNSSNQCVNSCPLRQFPNYTAAKCQNCPFDCYTCDNVTNACLTCNSVTDFRKMNETSKRCIPLDGFYESNLTVSAACPTGCAICVSPTKCILCSLNYFLNLNFSCLS